MEKQELISKLQDAAREYGETPPRSEIKKLVGITHGPFVNAFGSWSAAIDAAGLPRRLHKKKRISDDEILEAIKTFKNNLGRWPLSQDLATNSDMPKWETITKRFGSLENAYKKIDPSYKDTFRTSKEELIEDIKKVHNIRGHAPSQKEYAEHGAFVVQTIFKHFGAYNSAITASGFEPKLGGKALKVSDEDLKSELLRLNGDGYRLTLDSLKDMGCKYSRNAYKRYGWNKILKDISIVINHERGVSDEDMLYLLIDAERELGRAPETRDITDLSFYMPSYCSYITRFGSWNEALILAGIEVVNNRTDMSQFDDPQGTRTCTSCITNKDESEFSKREAVSHGMQSTCKDCSAEREKSDKVRETRRVYRGSEHGKKVKREAAQRRRAILSAAFVENVDSDKLIDRDGNFCYYCHIDLSNLPQGERTELEHKMPLIRGGEHSYKNCVLSCNKCNGSKGTMTDVEFFESGKIQKVIFDRAHRLAEDPSLLPKKGSLDAMFSSDFQKWETPWEFFNQLDEEFGFTLDAAAEHNTAKCNKYYTVETDGLSQSWAGDTVWINPPFGNEIKKWIKKAYEESVSGANTCVMLIPARTDTGVWHDVVWPHASEIRFVKGRINFLKNGTLGKGGSTFPSAIIVFNGNDGPPKVSTWEIE